MRFQLKILGKKPERSKSFGPWLTKITPTKSELKGAIHIRINLFWSERLRFADIASDFNFSF